MDAVDYNTLFHLAPGGLRAEITRSPGNDDDDDWLWQNVNVPVRQTDDLHR